MSLEILDQLEEKIRQAVETIQLLQLEVEELKEQKNKSQQAVQHENEQLRNEHRNWQEHIRSLLGKFDNV